MSSIFISSPTELAHQHHLARAKQSSSEDNFLSHLRMKASIMTLQLINNLAQKRI